MVSSRLKFKFSDKLSSPTDVVVHDPGGLEMKQVIACSPNMLNISCPEDHTIEIINGNFGRFTITLCNGKVREKKAEENVKEVIYGEMNNMFSSEPRTGR